MCLQSWHQIPRKIFYYLDSDSVRVSSQVLITCHDNTIIPNVCENINNIKFHVSSKKLKSCTQQLKHEKYRNQANQEKPQLFFKMSPSDLPATPSSEYLQERCSRHRHWETYDNKTNLKQKNMQIKPISTASINRRLAPLLNSNPMPALSHAVISENNKWTLSWHKSTILLSLDQANSSAFGTLLRDRYQGYTLR